MKSTHNSCCDRLRLKNPFSSPGTPLLRKKTLIAAVGLLVLVMTTHNLTAAVLVQYTCPVPNEFAPTTVAARFSASDLGQGGSTVSLNAGFALTDSIYFEPYSAGATTGGTTASEVVTNDRYFQFTLTNTATYSLSNLTFQAARGGASTPRGWVLRTSVDGFATNVASSDIPTVQPNFTQYSVDLTAPMYQNLTTAVTFRLYGYTPYWGTGIFFDNFTVNGNPGPAAINDTSSGNTTGEAVTVDVLANDTLGSAIVPSTVQIAGTSSVGASLVVAGQGTWTVNTNTGAITFTPQSGYTGDPTPIQYTGQDALGMTAVPATVTIDYNQYPPTAANDSSLHNDPGAVSLNVTTNDTDANGDLLASTVDLDPAAPGQQTAFTVVGEGWWTVDGLGNVTFTPQAGFTLDPTSISYIVSDVIGLSSLPATVTIDYVPVATSDTSSGNATGASVTVDVLANDTTGDTVVASTVQIAGTSNPGDSLVVAGQGAWIVNVATGAITFTPQPGYTGDPTPIQYSIRDAEGNASSPATVTIDYSQYAPVAVNDILLNSLPGPAVINATENDTDPNNDLDASTVDLDPATAGKQTTRVVAGQGTWSVDALGKVTFAPISGLRTDPTPLRYTVSDTTGLVSNPATITLGYNWCSHEILWQHSSGQLATWSLVAVSSVTGHVLEPAGAWQSVGLSDFDEDGNCDVLMWNANRRLQVRYLDQYKTVRVETLQRLAPSGAVRPAIFADVDCDGRNELIWRRSSDLVVWKTRASSVTSEQFMSINPALGTSRVVGMADFNGDGYADIVAMDGSGQLLVSLQQGIRLTGIIHLANGQKVAPAWHVAAITDFNCDRKPDILWKHNDGRTALWLMDGSKLLATRLLNNGRSVSPGWNIFGAK